MRDWLSASDLAELGLPGLPATKRGWLDYAEREGWYERKDHKGNPLVRVEQVRGGKKIEYHIDLLPAVTLAMYVSQHVGKVDIDSLGTVATAESQQPTTIAALEQRDARLTLVSAAERLARDANLSQIVADKLFAGLYRLGKIEVAPWVRVSVKKLSVSSLSRWRKHRRYGDLHRLGVDKGAARRGKGKLESGEEGKVRAFLLAAIAKQPHLSSDHLRELTVAQFPHLDNVSLRSFQRMRAKIEREDKVLLTRVTNPDKFKSAYRLSGSNSHPVSRLNEMWEIDASPADVMCVDGRHSVYLCIDIFSRRLIVYVSKTPRAEAVALLMRRAILAWGVPERVHTDNGSDFVAKSSQRLFAALGIEVELSAPFSPEQKGHVERAVRTFQHDLAPIIQGFIGHNVADRKVIEERRAFSQRLGLDDAGAMKPAYTGKQLQEICDDWAAGRYANRPHSGLGGATPFAVAAAFSGIVRRIDDVRALDLLLAPIVGGDGTRVVTKKGVRIDHSYYLTPNVLPETRVFVRRDPEDMGRAWLFSADGAEFLGEAICPELAGIDPIAAVAEARAQQKRFLEEGTAQLRADMKAAALDPRNMVDTIVRKAAVESGKLVEFPKREERYTTPGLAAASEAARTSDDPSPEEIRETMRRLDAFVDGKRAEVESDLVGQQASGGENVKPLRKESTPAQRMALARDIDNRLYRGGAVSEAELVWFGGYQRNPEIISMMNDGRERFRHAQYLKRIKATGEPLWPHEESWLKGYVGSSEYVAMDEIFNDFGEGGLR